MSTTPIDPLLPSCLNGSLDTAFNPIDAASYDPATWSYYKVGARRKRSLRAALVPACLFHVLYPRHVFGVNRSCIYIISLFAPVGLPVGRHGGYLPIFQKSGRFKFC
jgi:hypothetical protein